MSAAPFSLCVQIGHAGPQIISQMPHNEYHVTQYSGGCKLLLFSHTRGQKMATRKILQPAKAVAGG
jgi:hypothetical protein